MALRIVFMGTPSFAVPTLLEVAQQHHIVAVYTRPAKPAGRRGMALSPSPIERVAGRLDLPVLTPTTLRTEEAETIARAHQADVAVVVAYGLILPKSILDAFSLGAFNVHASLLPRWRGAAPIQRAIMAGDRESGVTIMKMEEGLDSGEIALAERVPIEPDTTAGDLHDALAPLGADLMVRALAALERGSLTLSPQSQSGITYAAKIEKGETRIDWTRPSEEVHNRIRGLSPLPGAWFELPGEGERVKVLRSGKAEGAAIAGTVIDDRLTIACGSGAVRLLELQRAGRQKMKTEEFLRGTPIAVGRLLQ
jgi:methionyl-tRNA formyltransferase